MTTTIEINALSLTQPSVLDTDMFKPRFSYKPFEYPEAYNIWEQDQFSFWLWNEDTTELENDIQDWHYKLSNLQKSIVGRVLKGFAQTETLVENYWLRVGLWFRKAEICDMAASFAAVEARHGKTYNFLNEKLGLEEYNAFNEEEAVQKRLSNLLEVKDKDVESLLVSLGIFSAFCEGVSLFAAFAVLLNFKFNSLLTGIGKLIEWSQRDEDTHSRAGIWLFNKILEERPYLRTESLKKKLYEGALTTITLEHNYIDYIFEEGNLEDLTASQLKNYVNFRANLKLEALGYKGIFEFNQEKSDHVAKRFDFVTTTNIETDFFKNKETAYTLETLDVSSLTW